MTAVTANGTRVIDCDVHCVLPTAAVLFDHLDPYWREFLTDAKFTRQQAALTVGYPVGAPTTASPEARAAANPPGSKLEALQEHVLDAWSMSDAVISCLTGFESLRHPSLSPVLLSATHDWLAAEWLDRDPRLKGAIAVSPHVPEAAEKEIRRLGGRDEFVEVMLPVRSPEPYGKSRFDPIFQAAVDFDLPVAVHAWGLSGIPPTASGFPQYYAEDYLANASIAETQITSLIFEGVFSRFPTLRVAVLECGFTWLKPLLWRLDKDWKGLRRETPWVTEPPSHYVREHVRIGAEPIHGSSDDQELREAWGMLGDDNVIMFSCDYPHFHGGESERLVDAIPDADRDALLWKHAAEMYRL